jgi:hypothetical protein
MSNLFTFPYNPELFVSIQHVLNRTIIKKNNVEIMFKAKSAVFLSSLPKKSLDEEKILRLTHCLYSQILSLKQTENKGFVHFHPNNILIIDDILFVCMDTEEVFSLTEGQLDITFPFIKSEYSSPHVLSVDAVPCSIKEEEVVTSLGLLASDFYAHMDVDTPVRSFIQRCVNQQIFLYL